MKLPRNQQQSLDDLVEARRCLVLARQHLGNDHPAYDRLVNMINETFEIERVYA